MGLSKKQKAFIEHYLQCWNATEAAKQAGYSARSAKSIGHENLTKPDLREEIDRRLIELSVSTNEALVNLASQARFDFSPYIEFDADLKPFINLKRLIADGHGHLIKSLKHTKYGVEVEFESKFKALGRILDEHHRSPKKDIEAGGKQISNSQRAAAILELFKQSTEEVS